MGAVENVPEEERVRQECEALTPTEIYNEVEREMLVLVEAMEQRTRERQPASPAVQP